MGWMKDATGDYLVGLRFLAAAAVVSGVLVITARVKPPVPGTSAGERSAKASRSREGVRSARL